MNPSTGCRSTELPNDCISHNCQHLPTYRERSPRITICSFPPQALGRVDCCASESCLGSCSIGSKAAHGPRPCVPGLHIEPLRPPFKQTDEILSNRFEDSQSLSIIGTQVQLTKALVSSVARPLVLRLRQARYEYDETNEQYAAAKPQEPETKGFLSFMTSICSGSDSCRGSGSVSDSPRSP